MVTSLGSTTFEPCNMLCFDLMQVPVYGHVQCGGCSIMLMYPLGAQSVKCSVCHFVTNVSQQANWAGASSSPAAARQRPGSQQKNTQTVVVENPSTLDEQGNEVSKQCSSTVQVSKDSLLISVSHLRHSIRWPWILYHSQGASCWHFGCAVLVPIQTIGYGVCQ